MLIFREALHDSPVSFGALVCQFYGVLGGESHGVLGGDEIIPDMPAPTAAQLSETLMGVDIAETTNALHVIAAITEDEILAARIRRILPDRRQPVHPVVERFTDVEVVDCLRLTDPFSESEHVVLPLRWPDGTEATLMVFIDHRLDGAIADVILGLDGHAEQRATLREIADQEGVQIAPIRAAEARTRIARALERWQAHDDPPENDSWPALSPFLTLVLDRMPAEPVELGDEPAVSPRRPDADFTPFVNTPITLAKAPKKPHLATLRIDLLDVEPPIWRQVAVRSDLTLDALAGVVNTVVGWAGGHLHRFWPGGMDAGWRGPHFVTDFDADVEGETGTRESEARVDQVLREPGDSLLYIYDFGDDWQHLVTLEGTVPLDDLGVRAICLEGERAGPLEDVGGAHMHNELVKTMTQPHGRYRLAEDLREWVPPAYDPADFDLTAVNVGLMLLTQTPDELLQGYTSRFGDPVRPEMAEGLERLIDKARPDDLARIVALVAEVREDQTPITTEEKRAALRHVQVLLDEAGEDGIPLTPAGWMKPDVVVRLVEALGLARVYGKGNRENQTHEVASLREGVLDVGLLRKNKGRLLLTAAGRKAREDVEVLWRHAVSRLAGAKNDFEREARALYLLLIAGGVGSRRAHAEMESILSRAGWRTEDFGQVSSYAVHRATDTSRAVLGSALREFTWDDPPEEPSVRRLARDAVLPPD